MDMGWQRSYSQSYGFSSRHVRMWELDHKDGWGQRIDAFELWCWRRLLRVPWTARRSHQSILKEINPENSLEGLMLKLQYFGHLMWRANSLENTLMLGKIEGRRRRGQQRMRCLDSITNSQSSDSYPLSPWCHSTISSSVVPFSSHLQSFPASEPFPMSQFFTSGGQSIRVLASASVFPMNIQDWFPLGCTAWISLRSKGLSRVFSNTTVQKYQFSGAQLSL